jgi:hypothetical protein
MNLPSQDTLLNNNISLKKKKLMERRLSKFDKLDSVKHPKKIAQQLTPL